MSVFGPGLPAGRSTPAAPTFLEPISRGDKRGFNMLKKIWYHLEEFILLPVLVFQVVLIFIQVIMRYVFSNSLSW